LVDATLEGVLTRRLAAELRHRFPNSKLVLLVSEPAIGRITEFVRIANHGILYEGTGFATVLLAIQAVLRGESFYDSHLTNALMNQLGSDGTHSEPRHERAEDVLTQRELEVLELISKERLCNKQIARRLGISLYTVKNHVHNIIEKLRVQDRYEASLIAQRRNLFASVPNSAATLVGMQSAR
jgi:DNA-binding NarL/FixJ family response regulator